MLSAYFRGGLRLADDGNDRHATTRRRFVVDTLSGLASVVLLDACGSATTTSAARPETGTGGGPNGTGGYAVGTGGDGGTGGSGGTGGVLPNTGGAPAVTFADAGAEAGTCFLYPQQTEGPFYLDLDLLRSDITEGKPGAPMALEITVLRQNGCAAIQNALVDVWQCDADGVYAGFPGQLGGVDTTGSKFLRGTQATGADGKVLFHTIYPGWYPGRTTHIHFKVHLSATSQVTSQMYFPEDVTVSVYQDAPYAARGQKDTSNSADSIAQTGGMPPVLAVTREASGLVAR